jgi:hypothetical protein
MRLFSGDRIRGKQHRRADSVCANRLSTLLRLDRPNAPFCTTSTTPRENAWLASGCRKTTLWSKAHRFARKVRPPLVGVAGYC